MQEKNEALWSKIRDLIKTVTKKSDDYDAKYIEIKFHSADNLHLYKTIEISITTIVVKATCYENNKFF